MCRIVSRTSVMLGIALCSFSLPRTALAQAPSNRPLQPGEQWVQLFNGKDLTNWVEVGKEKWTVEDGTIHGQGVTSAYGYLRTEKKYEDLTMTRSLWLISFAVVALGLIPAGASDGPQATEPGFTPLFNGKDLAGWVYGQRRGAENKAGKGYQVENGVIYSTKEDGGNLFTAKAYADFVFRFEFKLTENANNGIGIRAPLEGDAAYAGIEIQVLDDGGSQYTKLQPYQYHGSIYGMIPSKRGFQKPVGEWNTEEITAKGRQITVKLNGTTIVDASLDDVKDEAMLKTHRDLTKPEGSRGIANTKGHIGLLGHGARVEFRNLRIKEL